MYSLHPCRVPSPSLHGDLEQKICLACVLAHGLCVFVRVRVCVHADLVCVTNSSDTPKDLRALKEDF